MNRIVFLCSVFLFAFFSWVACGVTEDVGKECKLSDSTVTHLKENNGKSNVAEASFECRKARFCIGTQYIDEKTNPGYCSKFCENNDDCPSKEYICQKLFEFSVEQLPEEQQSTLKEIVGKSMCLKIFKTNQ